MRVHFNSKLLVSSYCLGDLHIWNKQSLLPKYSSFKKNKNNKKNWFCSHRSIYEDDICLNSRHDYVVSASERRSTIKIWDANRGHCVMELDEERHGRYAFAGLGTILTFGDLIAIGHSNSCSPSSWTEDRNEAKTFGLSVIDIRSGNVVKSTSDEGKVVGSVASHGMVSDEASATFAVTCHRGVSIWDWNKLECQQRIEPNPDTLFSRSRLHYDGRWAVTGFNVWDITKRSEGVAVTEYIPPATRKTIIHGSWADESKFVCWGPNSNSRLVHVRDRTMDNDVWTQRMDYMMQRKRDKGMYFHMNEQQNQDNHNGDSIDCGYEMAVRDVAEHPAWRDVAILPDSRIRSSSSSSPSMSSPGKSVTVRRNSLHGLPLSPFQRESKSTHGEMGVSPFVSVHGNLMAIGGQRTVKIYNYDVNGWQMRSLHLAF